MYAGGCLQVAGPFGGDDRRRRARRRSRGSCRTGTAVPRSTRVHVVVARHRLVAHRRVGVARRVLAERERDVREVIARAAVLVHVTAGEHRDLVDGPDHAERARPLLAVGEAAAWACAHGRLAGSALAGPPGDRDRALPGGDGHRRLTDDAAARAAAEPDLREPGDVAEPDVAGDVDLAVRLHRVRREAVDLRRLDARVVERDRDRLARERQLGVGQALAERRLPDADDRGLVLDQVGLTSPSTPAPGARGTTRHLRPSLRSRS